ncbi:MAG: NACHT domain-containing protein [Anaerolineales bacterium]|nr:NACHT domain-containing protein [Anaerolineales bacterium]
MSVGKAVTGVGAWAWEQFGENVKPSFLSFLKRKWDDAKEENEKVRYADTKWKDFSWGKAVKRYQEHMRSLYGHIRVIGSTEPVKLDNVFTDVFLLEKPQAFRRFDISQLSKLQKEPDQLDNGDRLRGLQVVIQKRGHRLYILGKPGAGKTTFLKYLVHQTLEAQLDKIPVFITLRDWANSNLELLPFIAKQFDICRFPDAQPFIEYILENGRAVIFFDGLDEVPEQNKQRSQITSSMHEFCRKYQESQVVITCRIAATDYSFTEFTYIEMADFSESQVKTYARKWFGKDTEKAERFLVELNKEENKGVRDLGRSPLLLSMICLAYDETLTIPKRRVELYEEALDALLKKWDSSRNIQRDEIYKNLSLGRKRQMFARLAAEAFEKGEIFFPKKQLASQIEAYLNNLPPTDIEDDIDGEVILQAISAQHGIFVERAKDIFSFAHLTFQEYYTAKYITDKLSQGTLHSLKKNLIDDRWHEVFLLTASLLADADEFFTSMLSFTQEFIKKDKTLFEIQEWVDKKSSQCSSDYRNAARAFYWFLALVRGPALDKALGEAIDPRLVRATTLPPDLAGLLFSSIAVTKSLTQNLSNQIHVLLNDAFNLSLNAVIESNLNSSSILERESKTTQILILETNITFITIIAEIIGLRWEWATISSLYPKIGKFYTQLKKGCKLISTDFSKLFEGIKLPPSQASRDKWIEFANDVRTNARRVLDIGYLWKLDKEQTVFVASYLKANLLLLECLNVALVSKRDAILTNILSAENIVHEKTP